jgi:hypothetical protein
MITSRNPTRLSDPNSGEPISGLDFAYIKARTRSEAFSTVHREFDNSGISQAKLATRMKKDQGRLSKMLGAPGNWTLDTVAELLWAISGARVKFTLDYPLNVSPKASDDLIRLQNSGLTLKDSP